MAIWVIKEGRREGPYEEQDVRELVYEGTYTDSEPAIRDGQIEWTTLGQLLGRQPPPPPEFVPPPYMVTAEPPANPDDSPVPAEEVPAPPSAPRIPRRPPPSHPAQVVVVDFQMPFGSMVIMMIKWTLAAIPAVLILIAISAIFWSFLFGLLATLFHN